MIPELRGYALILNTANGMFLRALDGVTDEQARTPGEGTNSLLWIAAHVVSVRSSFLRALGGSADVPWAAQFPRGSDPAAVTDWPSIADVKGRWIAVHAGFMARLDTLTSDDIAKETRVPGLEPTTFGVLGLATVHDVYHVGQLAMCRRRLGFDRLVG